MRILLTDSLAPANIFDWHRLAEAETAEEKEPALPRDGAEAEVMLSGGDVPLHATADAALPSAEEIEVLVASVRSATHAIVEASVLDPEKPVAVRLQRSFVAALIAVLSSAFITECRAVDALAATPAAAAEKGAVEGGDTVLLTESKAIPDAGTSALDDASWLTKALRQKRVVSAFERVARRVHARGDASQGTRLHQLVASR